ncbi:MAG: hypothetical protein BV458_04125 [Thermoplasmata archaeon M9B2D]|nr:MAG: hypothetical protein BV458_04125 [Thermoplasmata archaeon M9B2D]
MLLPLNTICFEIREQPCIGNPYGFFAKTKEKEKITDSPPENSQTSKHQPMIICGIRTPLNDAGITISRSPYQKTSDPLPLASTDVMNKKTTKSYQSTAIYLP